MSDHIYIICSVNTQKSKHKKHESLASPSLLLLQPQILPQTYKVVNDSKFNISGGVTTGHGDTKTGSQELADKVHAGLGNTEVSGDEAGQGDGGVEEGATDSSECPGGHHQSDSERECDTQHSSVVRMEDRVN